MVDEVEYMLMVDSAVSIAMVVESERGKIR